MEMTSPISLSATTQIPKVNTYTTMASISGPDPAVMDAISRGNVVVFLDIGVGDDENTRNIGRIKLELYIQDCPKTAENFRQFCTGEHLINEQPVGYKNCLIHRVMKDFMIQGGDFLRGDGSGSTSIYGTSAFADENFVHPHQVGALSSANSGPNTNGCQFFIVTGQADFLNGKHCVFGRVLDAGSMLVVRKIEATPVSGTSPRIPIKIIQCGEL